MQASIRQKEIADIWKHNGMTYRIFGGIVLVGIGILLGASAFQSEVASYITNLYTETMSIAVTVFILDLINRHRNEENRIREIRETLSRQLGSGVNVQAKRATEELRFYGWLQDGILHGLDLSRANLENLNLVKANLQQAFFDGANLQSAQLHYAQLQKAMLRRANLQDAMLFEANLAGADLSDAHLENTTATGTNFEGAKLRTTNLTNAEMSNTNLKNATLANAKMQDTKLNLADLRGADLFAADLRNARLNGANLCGTKLKFVRLEGAQIAPSRFGLAQLDKTTILPDGEPYQPELGLEQLERFTDPDHPDFWTLKW
jgi:uncharacterized protein YjbI with pentapeptide repeats